MLVCGFLLDTEVRECVALPSVFAKLISNSYSPNTTTSEMFVSIAATFSKVDATYARTSFVP